ncbi:hypothetical protein [Lysinibacter sp. HNR]|uniref:hypothetical protein n=1 Tax=Lysinibacter sp. HNR TaxID=3031408 RepID=UPI002435D50E|nr:hypothetical protein [Lysinibacter sp. HNR]WGD38467.1 hypothetical protein FrondiHNR_06040 [Lysinibacter sp. HNR]
MVDQITDIIEFGIPGGQGERGRDNQLKVGAVTSTPSGGAASASITGTYPTQILNLTLPRGEKGEKGDQGDEGNVTGLDSSLTAQVGGLIVRSAAGVIRPGLLHARAPSLVVGTSTMTYSVGTFTAAFARLSGATVLRQAGTVSRATTTAPTSNARLDVIYAIPPSSDAPQTPEVVVVQGAVAPVASLVKPAIPAGAIELAVAQVSAGATSTQGTGVVITQTAPYTATAGGVVIVRTATELAAWTPADGAEAYCLEDQVKYLRIGGTWAGGGTLMILSSAEFKAGWTILSSAAAWSLQGRGMGSTPWRSGLVAPWSGLYDLSGGFKVVTEIPIIFGVKLNSTAATPDDFVASTQPAPSSGTALGSFARKIRLRAGDVLTPGIYTTATNGPYGIIPGQPTWLSLDFVRP